jgi:putative transposase
MPAATRSEMYVHLVWSTWNRAPLLTPERTAQVYRAITRKCYALGCNPLAVGGIADHVHLLVRTPPRLSASALVKEVKGFSSWEANPQHGARAEFRWQGGFGAFSLSRQQVERIRRYVLNQPAHHANGTLVPFLEPDGEGAEEAEQ